MVSILDPDLDLFPIPGGWMAGCVGLVFAGLLAVVARRHSGRYLRPIRLLGAGFAVSGLMLLVADLQTPLDAATLLANNAPPTTKRGRYIAATSEMAVPASSVQAGYVVRLFYPSVGPATVGGPHPGGAGPVAPPLRDLAATALPAPVIVSLPGNGGWRWANASTATYLAQQGYVVLAIDDVDHDPPVEVVASPAALEFNYSSWAATLRTMRAADDKAHREAVRGIEALDALAKELGPAASRRLDLHRVGFWGYSFGAAAAAQAAILDSRVAAVANEDGSVFGAPARGVSPTPYLLLAEYEALDPAALRSSEPVRHNYALTVAADHHLWRSLAARPDHYGFILHGAKHENFSDAIFGHRFFKRWLLTSPRQIQAERAAYLLAFFDTYLRKRPAALLDQHPPPFPKTEALKGSRRWAAMADAVPVSADERWLFNPE